MGVDDILLKKWKFNTITGDVEPEKQEMCIFNNTAYACQLLNKHIKRNSVIALHTDVDMDGLGSTYILKKFLESHNSSNHIYVINKDKIHGIQEKHVDYFNENKIDLIIITDSSTNELDTIKSFECDVLVIDHHEILHEETFGYCNNGSNQFVIVNNTIDNKNYEYDESWVKESKNEAFKNISRYIPTVEMSCGLVVYELLRVYCNYFSDEKILENLMLYQWVGVTLLTDAIQLVNERNQWYIGKTVSTMETESTLKIMLDALNGYKHSLDKSFINYTLAPLINKAIRAGAGSEALNVVINNPKEIESLKVYSVQQDEAIDKIIKLNKSFGKYVHIDITDEGINENYTGVIASRLVGQHNKNAVVYKVKDGMAKGSFRGLDRDVDYRGIFDSHDNVFAQGHKAAFGFNLKEEKLHEIMEYIADNTAARERKNYLSMGEMPEELKGTYHIDSLEEFRRAGYMWRLAIGNSRVNSDNEINITVPASDVVLDRTIGKLYIYNVLGIECKAFNILKGKYFNIYAEYSNEITFYIRDN